MVQLVQYPTTIFEVFVATRESLTPLHPVCHEHTHTRGFTTHARDRPGGEELAGRLGSNTTHQNLPKGSDEATEP